MSTITRSRILFFVTALLSAEACSHSVNPLSSGPATCGGVVCGQGQSCCLATLQCYDPLTSPQACTDPAVSPPDGGAPYDPDSGMPRPCSSTAQCRADEYCLPDPVDQSGPLCMGQGHCASRTSCGSGGAVCGCDGVTYPTVEAACAAGAPWTTMSACGVPLVVADRFDAGGSVVREPVIACGSDSQCPSGTQCCGRYGRCYNPSTCPTCCDLPPAGTRSPCNTDAQCGAGWFCQHDTCNGPGGCKLILHASGANCAGVNDPVCGCDGRTYTNACAANAEGVNVASHGPCP